PDAATPPTSPLSLHDALPIWHRPRRSGARRIAPPSRAAGTAGAGAAPAGARDLRPGGGSPRRAGLRAGVGRRRAPRPRRLLPPRSEEHTSELQSLAYLVCRLL